MATEKIVTDGPAMVYVLTNAQTWDNIRYYDQFSWLWNFLGFGTNEHILNAVKAPITC